jgi:large subunit ribosomal protein L21
MYAVIELQGAQIYVEKDDKIVVNRISDQKSKTVKVDKVLFGKKGASYLVGEPYLKDAYVECEILGDKRLKKVIAFKYRDRKSSQSKKGHRQDVTELKVKNIHFAETAKAKEKE